MSEAVTIALIGLITTFTTLMATAIGFLFKQIITGSDSRLAQARADHEAALKRQEEEFERRLAEKTRQINELTEIIRLGLGTLEEGAMVAEATFHKLRQERSARP